METELPRSSADRPASINMLSSADIAYWCRVFDVDMTELRRAVQQVGPQAQSVRGYLARQPRTSG
ncbi:DUF3606 domain-containing protein [Sphaerotilus sp.]|uniref:DUF3606 domain-containing protein n=1 Tax=Sphaerotilus sp. TaxID=2093942 RepID=UPI0034E213FF